MAIEVAANLSNEGRACDAVLRLLEERTGEARADISHPERDHSGPPVDLRVRLGAQSYAIEHTRIEAFYGQIHQEEEFGQLINPVIDELSGTLPGPGKYLLLFPSNTRLKVETGRLEDVRSEFIDWVREHAARLQQQNPDRPTRERNPRGFRDEYRSKPPGFPYEVTLLRESHWALSPRHDGILLAYRYAPEEVEALRVARLKKALERKCPKLKRCNDDGMRTVLVLEDGDISLSHYGLVGDALLEVMGEYQDLPDEIYLIETSCRIWDVRLMKYDEHYLPDVPHTEFVVADLVDIT